MNLDDDAEILAAVREGFLDEAADMLRQFEQALLVMETDPADQENLNAAFRAAHTIKGTAGLFGCEAVVAFTHEVETLMDALRAGERAVDADVSAALLDGLDQMAALVAEVRSGQADPAVSARSQVLGQRLRGLMHGADGAAAAPVAAVSAAPAAPSAVPGPTGCWHLSLRFGRDALRNGLDPMAFLRYLGSMGEVRHCHTLAEDVPELSVLDAEDCHLGFELRLLTEQGRAEIVDVFEFAIDDCAIDILAPDAPPEAFEALLQARCGDDAERRAALQAVWQEQDACAPRAPAATGAGAAAAQQPSPTPAAAQAEAAAALPAGAEPAPPAGPAPAAPRRPGPAAEETRFVKVRADKLDHLIDLIGELLIAGSGAQMVAVSEGSPAFLEATQRLSDLVQATRDGALALRMVPIGETFSRFHRVVRDISRQLGKDIEFVVTGGDTELDKSMVEVLADPLMHLVRNSLDHGVETPEARRAAGKPPTGRLGLHAYHESGAIVIEVSDDGHGLNRERILRKARERGLVADGSEMSDADVWQLIFAPGFSTADAVTDLSGRGVGMDVVKRNIESLRGQIALASQDGQGTTTQIRLPLTLAMIDGFLTLVGGVHYVLPLAVVSECIDLPPECVADPARTCGTFDLRGEVMPYLDLARFYGVAAARGGRRSLVVVRDGTVRIGLVVDRLLGEHQTVIKPLPAIFKPLEALAGSTILGSGDVALVLDMPGLMNAALRPRAAARPPAGPAARSPAAQSV
jgi:two-component system, chemotaxis family, sensor kinase CheA